MEKSGKRGKLLNAIRLELIIARNILKSLYYNLRIHFSNKSLSENHFNYWSEPDHVNFAAFQKIESLMGGKPQVIIETGTSAWGTESTRFWDAYVRKYGGEVWSVDIRSEPKKRLKFQTSRRTHLTIGDSVEFLASDTVENPTIVFLDSWDVDWSNPKPAAVHGLKEFKSVLPKLQAGSYIFIDDSPSTLDYIAAINQDQANEYLREEGVLPGKGADVLKMLEKGGVEPIFHKYSMILETPDKWEFKDHS